MGLMDGLFARADPVNTHRAGSDEMREDKRRDAEARPPAAPSLPRQKVAGTNRLFRRFPPGDAPLPCSEWNRIESAEEEEITGRGQVGGRPGRDNLKRRPRSRDQMASQNSSGMS